MPETNVLLGNQQPQEVTAGVRVTQVMLPNGVVHARHVEQGTALVKFGLASERPTTGDIYPFFVARDTGVVSLWNGSAWLSSTFS